MVGMHEVEAEGWGDYFGIIDVDTSTDMRQAGFLVSPLANDEADVVIGSRQAKGGTFKSDPRIKWHEKVKAKVSVGGAKAKPIKVTKPEGQEALEIDGAAKLVSSMLGAKRVKFELDAKDVPPEIIFEVEGLQEIVEPTRDHCGL